MRLLKDLCAFWPQGQHAVPGLSDWTTTTAATGRAPLPAEPRLPHGPALSAPSKPRAARGPGKRTPDRTQHKFRKTPVGKLNRFHTYNGVVYHLRPVQPTDAPGGANKHDGQKNQELSVSQVDYVHSAKRCS